MPLYIEDLTKEDEERIIDRIATEVVSRGLDSVAIMILESIKPMTYIGSQLTMVFTTPFLGDIGIDYIKFFEKQQNVERVLQRIEQEVKIRDEETKQAKEDRKLIYQKFGIRLELLPGFLLRDDASRSGLDGGTVGITRKERAGGGFLGIYFKTANLAPDGYQETFSSYLKLKETQQVLNIDENVRVDLVKELRQSGKLKGHELSVANYEWKDNAGRKGLVECYGFWCSKTHRLFVLSLRTRELTGDKKEKNQINELRMVLGSLKCH